MRLWATPAFVNISHKAIEHRSSKIDCRSMSNISIVCAQYSGAKMSRGLTHLSHYRFWNVKSVSRCLVGVGSIEFLALLIVFPLCIVLLKRLGERL